MWRLLLGTLGVKSLVQGLNAAATAGFEPRTVWSEVRRRNRLATAPPKKARSSAHLNRRPLAAKSAVHHLGYLMYEISCACMRRERGNTWQTKYEGDGTTLSQLQTVSTYTRRVSVTGYTMLPAAEPSNAARFLLEPRFWNCLEFDQKLLIEDHIQAYLKELRGSKEISKDAYADMVPSGSTRPRRYGLPKVHEEGVPLRPILSMIGSPQHALAKWLCGLLKPVEKFYTHRCVKDSFAFADLVKAAALTPGGYMCSFDVVSLPQRFPWERWLTFVLTRCLGMTGLKRRW